MIAVEQSAGCGLGAAVLRSLAEQIGLIARVIETTERVRFGTVTVLIVGVDEICNLHERFMDDPGPTDVITFPSGDTRAGVVDGDIAICLDVARSQAAAAGHDWRDEIVFLAVHGLLHLVGWDDQNDDARRAMLDRQAQLIALARTMGQRQP